MLTAIVPAPMPTDSRIRRGPLLWGALALLVAAAAVVALVLSDGSSAAQVRGAAALPDQPTPQESADGVEPSPTQARADRGPIVADGCMVGKDGTESDPTCVYGDKRGKWTVYLFGDSHAMEYFSPLEKLAKENRWRLVVLNKRECSPADTHVIRLDTGREYGTCDAWHRITLRRIGESAGHGTVVLSGDKAARAFAHGQALSGGANAAAMELGYVKTLKKIRRSGLGAVVVKDLPSSPKGIPHCVAEHMHELKACAFPRVPDANLEFDAAAARSVPKVTLIDLTPEVCPHELCRAVIGNALTYRDKDHLTATFARTLEPMLESDFREDGLL